MDSILITILMVLVGLLLVILVLSKPFLGIALTVAGLPILDLLPDIPYISSILPLVGFLALFGYLLQKKATPNKTQFQFSRLHGFALLFIIWIFVSNPQAAWPQSGRNWMLTFLQLFLLMYLAGELIDTPKKQQITMGIFSVCAIVSAFYAIQTGTIGETFDLSTRAEGFVDNTNAAARYFTVAMVFLSYLRSQLTNRFLKIPALVGILVTYLGVFYTLSRTGMLLLFAAQGLIFFMQTKGKQKISIIVVFVIGLGILWWLSDNIFGIIQSIFPTIINQEDTFGLRINLWKSGLMMWLDHPIRGVGIGMYPKNLYMYISRLEGYHRSNAVAHNTYIQVLSETGLIGLILFMGMLIAALKNYLKEKINDLEQLTLRNSWLIALIVMLLGGITKSDHADKLSWMVMGISLYFARQPLRDKQEVKTENMPPSTSMVVTSQK